MNPHREHYTPEPEWRRHLERAADVVLAVAIAAMLTMGLLEWFGG